MEIGGAEVVHELLHPGRWARWITGGDNADFPSARAQAGHGARRHDRHAVDLRRIGISAVEDAWCSIVLRRQQEASRKMNERWSSLVTLMCSLCHDLVNMCFSGLLAGSTPN